MIALQIAPGVVDKELEDKIGELSAIIWKMLIMFQLKKLKIVF